MNELNRETRKKCCQLHDSFSDVNPEPNSFEQKKNNNSVGCRLLETGTLYTLVWNDDALHISFISNLSNTVADLFVWNWKIKI